MSRWTKHLLAVAVVATLVLGAVAGRALAQTGPGDEQARPRQEEFLNRLAAGLGVPVEELKEAIQSAELEMLDDAIETGRVRPEVGERLRQRIEEGPLLLRLTRPHPQALGVRVAFRLMLHAAAETLEMTPRELVAELRASGQSLAELAEGEGLSREALKSAILEDVEKHVGEHLNRLSENIDRIIDRTPGSPPDSPPR